MLANKFEKPKNIGDKSKILLNITKSEKEFPEAKDGKINLSKKGVKMKTKAEIEIITKKKKVNI